MNGNTSFELETSVEAELGNITIVRKDGMDGGNYPLLRGPDEWTMGRGEHADIKFKVKSSLDFGTIYLLHTILINVFSGRVFWIPIARYVSMKMKLDIKCPSSLMARPISMVVLFLSIRHRKRALKHPRKLSDIKIL